MIAYTLCDKQIPVVRYGLVVECCTTYINRIWLQMYQTKQSYFTHERKQEAQSTHRSYSKLIEDWRRKNKERKRKERGRTVPGLKNQAPTHLNHWPSA